MSARPIPDQIKAAAVALLLPFLKDGMRVELGADGKLKIFEDGKLGKLCTFPEAAKFIGYSVSSLHRFVDEGRLTTVKIRGRSKLRLCELEALTNAEG